MTVPSEGRYWIGLGANLGDRVGSLAAAVRALEERGLTVEAVSHLYETAPREVLDQPVFLNAAVRARSDLGPREALAACKDAERAVGRVPGIRYGPRAIDCDVLLWSGGEWDDAALRIPHRRLLERRFALLPLLDLDPDLALPDGTALAPALAALDPAEQPADRLSGAAGWPPIR